MRPRLAASPEPWIVLFALLLNYPWEFLQVPLFAGLADLPHRQVVAGCSLAAVGDGFITVLAFWSAAAWTRSRRWLLRPSGSAWLVYLGTGLAVTVALEWLATEQLGRWSYAPEMPRIPLLGTGVIPLLQWLLLPPLVVLLTRGQLRGAERPAG